MVISSLMPTGEGGSAREEGREGAACCQLADYIRASEEGPWQIEQAHRSSQRVIRVPSSMRSASQVDGENRWCAGSVFSGKQRRPVPISNESYTECIELAQYTPSLPASNIERDYSRMQSFLPSSRNV